MFGQENRQIKFARDKCDQTIFVKVSKSLIFLVKPFLVNFFQTFGDYFLVTLLGIQWCGFPTLPRSRCHNKILAQLRTIQHSNLLNIVTVLPTYNECALLQLNYAKICLQQRFQLLQVGSSTQQVNWSPKALLL